MAEDPNELVKQGFRAYNDGGPSAFIDFLTRMDAMDDDFVMEIQADAPNGGEWHGVAGFEEMARIWLEEWEVFEVHPEEPIQTSPGRFLVPVRQHVVARASGMELEAPFFYTFEFADGRCRRIGLFLERSLAEQDLGVVPRGV